VKLPAVTARVASYVAEAAEAALRQTTAEIGTPQAEQIADDATALLRAPATLVTRLATAIADVPDIGRVEWLANHALTLPAVPQTTAQRRIQAANQTALQRMVRDLAALDLATRLPGRTFPSRTELAAATRQIADSLEAVRSGADDAVHRAVATLRRHIVEHVRQASADLPEVTTAAPGSVLPALVVAYDVHEDIGRADEIAARNSLPRPGFVPARPIEVLT